ncbi:MAG: SDR family oxidoreductase [Nitrososphaeraceae archaeon]|jgi:NAD(P)-dependent dehydrogenase (short-subunit alcohol dehydrogenase family)
MNDNKRKRIALVTGGNRGLGYETCRQLAQLGLTVLLGARDLTKGKSAAYQLNEKEGLDVMFYQLDVSDTNSISNVVREIDQRFGCLDVLINNAAILYDTWQNTVDADLEVVNDALRTNLFGPWRLSQAFIPMMKANKYGRIVNVSSLGGSLQYTNYGGTPAYSISKAALNMLTRKLAAELVNTGILVNSVDPGWVATDMGGHGGRPVQEGAKGIVWAAILPDNGPSGGFFYDGKAVPW